MPGDLSYTLDGFQFGASTDFMVHDIAVGDTEVRANDVNLPRQDGIRFGRDYMGGRLISFEMILLSGNGETALNQLSALQTAWLADAVRGTPGAVSVLTMTRSGRTRRCYGRPRRFALGSERSRAGWVSVTADFQCVDHLFYSDAELTTTIGMSAPSVGGLTGPLIGPIDAESAGEGVQDLFVGGTVHAWPVFQIHGPIIDPTIEVVGQWTAKLSVTLASDEYVTIDPTPWNRAVRRSNGANLAGGFTAASQRLSQMRIPPGRQQILLRGLDPTGTASVQVYVREAYAAY